MAEMMLFSMDGIVVNDETLSVDVIKEVGPRSDFLAHMNTFENMYIQSKPKLIDRLTRDRWNEAGHLDMESRALIAAKELSPHGNRNPSLRRHVPVSGSAQRRRT